MKYDENDNFYIIQKISDCFVYILLKNNEVVYVGQTSVGLSRPYSHNDKDFDSIGIFYCDKDKLDLVEDNFIKKYAPKYNKQVNYNCNYSLNKVRTLIRENTDIKNFNLVDFKKIAKSLEIKTHKYFTTTVISIEDYDKILNYIKNGNYTK